jgi:hypothetical protein
MTATISVIAQIADVTTSYDHDEYANIVQKRHVMTHLTMMVMT